MMPPINFSEWIENNLDKLKPPVNNYCIQRGDFIVMAVGGPNARNDYHVNETEEWFYQYKGDMLLKIVENGEFKDLPIKQGEMFLLPANTPHNPVRFSDTIGVVIERNRNSQEIDKLRWYCEKCEEIVYEEQFHCVDLGTQLKPIIEKYASTQDLRRCSTCGFDNPAKVVQ